MYTVYKVMKEYGSRFCSAVMIPNDGEFFQRYEIGVTVHPKVGKFLAFEHLEDAEAFLKTRRKATNWKPHRILECQTTGWRTIKRIPYSWEVLSFRAFWGHDGCFALGNAPKGSVACDDITPIKVVR